MRILRGASGDSLRPDRLTESSLGKHEESALPLLPQLQNTEPPDDDHHIRHKNNMNQAANQSIIGRS